MSEEKKEEAGHGEEEGEKGKKKKLPILWIIVGLLVVLIAVGGVLIVMLSGGGGEEKADKHGKKEHVEEGADEHAEEAPAEGEHAAAEGEGGHGGGGDGEPNCPHAVEEGGGHGAKGPVLKDIYPLDPFIVNLSGESERNFLKVTVHLKLAKAECMPFVDPHVPEIRDSILLLLSSKEYEMIKSVQGKMELRDEVLERVNHIVKGNRVKGAFFTDFVAQ
jgi:flagellar FliL protein